MNAVAGQMVDVPPMKRCPGCRETRPLDAFWRNRSRYDGRSTYCRACRHLANPSRPKAMLPTEPLVGPLREAIGERGNRGPRNGEPGIHRLAARMAAMYGGPSDRYRVQIDCLLRGVLSRIHFASADRIALAIGRHPAEIAGVGLHLLTQEGDDVLCGPLGAAILQNTTVNVLLGQDRNVRESTVGAFGLSDGEWEHLASAERGTGLLITGAERCRLRVPAFGADVLPAGL